MRSFIAATIFLLSYEHLAHAKADARLTEYFKSQLVAAQKTMAANPPPASAKLVDYNIDIIPQVGVGISEVFHLSLSPEIDFVFTPPTTN